LLYDAIFFLVVSFVPYACNYSLVLEDIFGFFIRVFGEVDGKRAFFTWY